MKTGRGLPALMVLAWMAAAPVQAHDQDYQKASDNEAVSGEMVDATLGCIAAYDHVLAQDGDDEAILDARDAAIDLYADLTGESDADIASEIRQADADLMQWLANGGDTLEDYRMTCDEAFLDNMGFGSGVPQAI